jgi:hypothetical protein
MKKSFPWYYYRSFINLQSTFELLLNNEKYFIYGFIYILIPLIGYTLMYIFLTIGGGAPSVFTPWLNIPKETYYSVNRFLVAPSLIIAWLLSASVMQILSKLSKGVGSFEQTIAILLHYHSNWAIQNTIVIWKGKGES